MIRPGRASNSGHSSRLIHSELAGPADLDARARNITGKSVRNGMPIDTTPEPSCNRILKQLCGLAGVRTRAWGSPVVRSVRARCLVRDTTYPEGTRRVWTRCSRSIRPAYGKGFEELCDWLLSHADTEHPRGIQDRRREVRARQRRFRRRPRGRSVRRLGTDHSVVLREPATRRRDRVGQRIASSSDRRLFALAITTSRRVFLSVVYQALTVRDPALGHSWTHGPDHA